jgi:hypothetical protein
MLPSFREGKEVVNLLLLLQALVLILQLVKAAYELYQARKKGD